MLFSGGLDSAVLLAHALADGPAQPLYVGVGLAWEAQERDAIARLLAHRSLAMARPLVPLRAEMRDVYPADHWALEGRAPAYDTPDEDVYLEGRNLVLLAKATVYMAREGLTRVLLGPLAGNPFPDARVEFFDAMARAVSLGLGRRIDIEAPFSDLHKAAVIRLGARLGVPMELTLSCMQPRDGLHCGACSKCRERIDAFREAGVEDRTRYLALRRDGGG